MSWRDIYDRPGIKSMLKLAESPIWKAIERMPKYPDAFPRSPVFDKIQLLQSQRSVFQNIIEQQERIGRVLPYFLRPKINYPESEQQRIRKEVEEIARKPGRPRKEKPVHIMEVVEPVHIELFKLVLRDSDITNQYDRPIKTHNKYRLWAFVKAGIKEGFFKNDSATTIGDLLQEYLGFNVTKLKQDIGFDGDFDKYSKIIKGCISGK